LPETPAVLNAEPIPPVAVLVTVLVVFAFRVPLPTTEPFSKPNTLLLVLSLVLLELEVVELVLLSE
jgi:hypothetical protein